MGTVMVKKYRLKLKWEVVFLLLCNFTNVLNVTSISFRDYDNLRHVTIPMYSKYKKTILKELHCNALCDYSMFRSNHTDRVPR